MGDGIEGFYRVGLHKCGDLGFGGGGGVEEDTAAFSFEKSNAPTVGVFPCSSSTFTKTGEGEADVRGDVAIHSEELAHGGFSYAMMRLL